MRLQLIILLSVSGCLSFFGHALHAEPYHPATADTVIASWPVISSPEWQQAQAQKNARPQDPAAVVALANYYLALANMPGQSRLYGLAQAALNPLVDKNTIDARVWLAWAQVRQHQHGFDEALVALAKVTASEPNNTNANLLAARIYLIQDKPAQARQACLALLGSSDLLTTSACVLEITSHQPNELAPSYEQLIKLVKREQVAGDERAPWLAQLLADMALRLGDANAAANWLAPHLSGATVNYLSQWADTQVAQGNYQAVLDYLTPVVTSAAEVDDLLLLQLALAEKNVSNNQRAWQTQLAERVALREQRQDSQHANELARYYLDINHQPHKALQWAQLHTQNSREYNDKKLLERAQAAVAALSLPSVQEPQ